MTDDTKNSTSTPPAGIMRESAAAVLVLALIVTAVVGALALRSVVHWAPTSWSDLHGEPQAFRPPPPAQLPWVNNIHHPQPNQLLAAALPRFGDRMAIRWWWADKPFQTPHDPRLALLCQPASPEDAAKRQAIFQTITAWLTSHNWPKVTILRNEWLPELLRGGRYNTAARLCQIMTINLAINPGWPQVMMLTRAECFLAVKHPNAALRCAVRMFNVCSMRSTATAIVLIAQCLQQGAEAGGSFKRFVAEQTIGLVYHPLTAANSHLPPDFSRLSPGYGPHISIANNTLAACPLTAGVYAAVAGRITDESFDSLMTRGNLYLLGDEPRMAAAMFARGYSLAQGHQMYVAENGIARCLKAWYKLLGPANQWVAFLAGKPQHSNKGLLNKRPGGKR